MLYRSLLNEKLEEFRTEVPEYTFAQTVFAALKRIKDFENFKKSDLLEISDEDFYSLLNKALKEEKVKLAKYE